MLGCNARLFLACASGFNAPLFLADHDHEYMVPDMVPASGFNALCSARTGRRIMLGHFHHGGVFTAMFIVGQYNHKRGMEPRVSRPKRTIFENRRARRHEIVPRTLWTRKSHSSVL